jgi:hypothetical protein
MSDPNVEEESLITPSGFPYDPLSLPAKASLSQQHFLAHKVGPPDPLSDRCKCCNFELNKKVLQLIIGIKSRMQC